MWVAARPQDAPHDFKTNENKKIPESNRAEDDGILLKIPIRVYGKQTQALVDSGATRSFVSPNVGAAPTTRRSLVGLARSRACSPRTSFPDGVEAWRCCAVRTPALWDRPGRSVLECAGRERRSVRQSTNYRRQRRPDNKSPASAAGDRCGIH